MARQRWEDEFWEKISGSDLARMARIRKSNGNEAILFPGKRSRMGITANTEKAGHGPPLDLGFIDEAFAHEDDRLEQAFSPAMLTRKMAQLWWASAGGTTKSVWLNKKREKGRELIEALFAALAQDAAAARPRAAYFEWFAPEDMDRADPATWRATLPALGYTVTEATIAAELEKMDAGGVRPGVPEPDAEADAAHRPERAQGRLARPGRRGQQAGGHERGARYRRGAGPQARRDQRGLFAGGRQGAPGGRGAPHGTDWVVPAMARLHSLWAPVAVAVAASGAPASSLIDDLIAAGIDVPKDKEHPLAATWP
jgi:hypothetical protein